VHAGNTCGRCLGLDPKSAYASLGRRNRSDKWFYWVVYRLVAPRYTWATSRWIAQGDYIRDPRAKEKPGYGAKRAAGGYPIAGWTRCGNSLPEIKLNSTSMSIRHIFLQVIANRSRGRRWGAFLSLLLILAPRPCRIAETNPQATAVCLAGDRLERILVRPIPGKSLEALDASTGVRRLQTFPNIHGLEILEVPVGTTTESLLSRYRQSGLVVYAEPDHIVHAQLQPNENTFADGTLWHLNNTGASGGIAGADIGAAGAWNSGTSAAGVVVAVVDSGIRYTHQDLAPNMWHNPNEGTDGYKGDRYGINAITGSGDPWDDYGHGSHVAGIIGAVGNNGVGVVGVCWAVKLMALKFINSQGQGNVSDAITCINFAVSHYAKVINFSWGDPTWNSQALHDAIVAAGNAGVIFVAAAGNLAQNIDYNTYYPASYSLPNLITVAATDRRDQLGSYSSYGPSTVSLGAPGDAIYSCWNGSDSSYQFNSGTSMATPVVAGACALLWATYPNESYADIIHRVMWYVTPLPGLAGKCVSGGRLNLQAAMQASSPTPTSPWPDASNQGGGWKRSSWFGDFNDTYYPWIYHAQHGWMYVFGTNPSSIWLWTTDMGFLWTGNTVYPWLWRDKDSTWVYYLMGSQSPRWFFDWKTQKWESHNP
jgi:subtilisin family serine protease